MKKFYAFAAAAVAALSMNAQTLYICGAGDGLDWVPTAPMEVELVDGAYTFDIDNLTQFKISTAIGEPAEGDTDGWNSYNAAAKTCVYTEDDLGSAVALEDGDANIGTPWKGLYHIVVAGDLSTITMTTTTEKPTGFTPLYVRGAMNEWGAGDEWKFSTEDGITYTFVCQGETVIPAGIEFKIADADWDKYNFSAGGIVTVDDYSYWFAGNDNSTMAEDFEGTITFKLPGEGETEAEVYFDTTELGAVSAIEAENAPAEYFNLQGVRVANPENGLYIVRQGSKVTKQVIR